MHERHLVNFSRRIVGDEAKAQEIVQDAFLRLWECRRTDVRKHAKQWLFTVCRNLALDACRREKHRVQHARNAEQEPLMEESTLRFIEQREEYSEVLEMISTLTTQQQEVLQLRLQVGLSYREISETTGLSVSNIGVILHTALEKIQTMMDRRNHSALRRGGEK